MKKDSKTKIASTYALALYEGAEQRRAVEAVVKDVETLTALLREDKNFVAYLANPLWDAAAKKAALKSIAPKLKLSSETLNCLDILADNGRFGELALILDGFRKIYYQKHGIEEVEVASVKALSPAQDKKLKAELEKLLQKKVVVNYLIMPELLGGLRIKYGSSMIDDTLAGKLNRLELVMKGGR